MTIAKLDLNLLTALDALLDERSVTRAAERLGMSQPALSHALGRLRRCFGDPLFVRAPRGLIATPHALAIADEVKALVRQAQDLLRPANFDPMRASGRVAIATTDYMQATLVVPLLERLAAEAPGLALVVGSLEPADIALKLERGELDLGITILAFAPETLTSTHLYRERYVGVARKGHPILDRPVTIDALSRYRHALVTPRGGVPQGPMDEALSSQGRKRDVALAVPNFLILPLALQRTDLIAVVPKRLADSMSDRLDCFELPLALAPFDVIAVWHPRVQNDQRHRWLRTMLTETARASDGRT